MDPNSKVPNKKSRKFLSNNFSNQLNVVIESNHSKNLIQ